MKKKKRGTDISSIILKKARRYVHEPDSSSQPEEGNAEVPRRKATEADKERKRLKRRLKRQEKLRVKEQALKGCDRDKARKLALDYLHLWSTSKSEWTFKKKRQIWLLNNAFNINEITDDDFEILLEHVLGLKGGARARLLSEAEGIIKRYEQEQCNSTADSDVSKDSNISEDVFQRARSVIQMLV